MKFTTVLQVGLVGGLCLGSSYGIHCLIRHFGGYGFLFSWLILPGVYLLNVGLTVGLGVAEEMLNPCKIGAWNCIKSEQTARRAWEMYQFRNHKEEFMKKYLIEGKLTEELKELLDKKISELAHEAVVWFFHIIAYIYAPILMQQLASPSWFYSISSRVYSGLKLGLMISNFCGTIKSANQNKTPPSALQPHFEMEPGYFGFMVVCTFYLIPCLLG